MRDFQFFGKIEYCRYYTQKCTHMQEAVVKKKDTMTESTENIKKQSTHIFHFQNFVTDIFAKHFERFQFFGKIEYWRYYTQKCTHIQEAVVKKKDTTTESMENTKKQSTHIFHFQNFVTEIFAKHFERFSIFWKN